MLILTAALLFGSEVATLPGRAVPESQAPTVEASRWTLTDLSESGAAMSFAVHGSRVEVELLAAADWDQLDLSLAGAVPGEAVHFRIAGARESWIPATSVSAQEWTPVTTRIVPGAIEFSVEAPAERFLVRLPGLAPPATSGSGRAVFYPYNRYLEYLGRVAQEPLAAISQVGMSGQGRPLYRILIDKPSPKEKKTVLMGVRQHGNEYGSSYLLEGALDLLLGRGGLTPEPELLDDIRWIIYPMMNPDGSVMNIRYNASGIDLNRDWERNGCNASQTPEIFALQCDLEGLQASFPIAIGGDHHGWGNSNHGGFRYAQGLSTSFVTVPEYDEAKKDTDVIALHDPSQFAWQENGGTPGMLRSEMFLRFGFLLHTPEYNGSISTEQEFYVKGQAWVRAMHDTLFAPRFTDQAGVTRMSAQLPNDQLFVTVDDLDENQNAGVRESVSVVIWDPNGGDAENLVLLETGVDTGVFRNELAIGLGFGTAVPGDGAVQSTGGVLFTRYVDDDYSRDASVASINVLTNWEPQTVPVQQP